MPALDPNQNAIVFLQGGDMDFSGMDPPYPLHTHVFSTSDPPNGFAYKANLRAHPPCTISEPGDVHPLACLSCQNMDAKMLCKCKARYCNTACQSKDWEVHKKECGGVHVLIQAKMHYLAHDPKSEDYGRSRAGYYMASSSAMGLKKLKPWENDQDKKQEKKLVDYIGQRMVWSMFSRKFMEFGRTKCHACSKVCDSAIWTGNPSEYKVDRKGSHHVVILYDVFCFCSDPECAKKIVEKLARHTTKLIAAGEKYESGFNIDDQYYPEAKFLI